MSKIKRYSKLKQQCNLPKGYEIIDECHKSMFEFFIPSIDLPSKDWRNFDCKSIGQSLIVVERDELNKINKTL